VPVQDVIDAAKAIDVDGVEAVADLIIEATTTVAIQRPRFAANAINVEHGTLAANSKTVNNGIFTAAACTAGHDRKTAIWTDTAWAAVAVRIEDAGFAAIAIAINRPAKKITAHGARFVRNLAALQVLVL
jgi:hypothetical protein